MAPEQFDGRADARSDQWGYCVAAFEALYGERPFTGRTTEDLRQAIAMGDIPPAPVGTRVPPWMHRVLSRGLSYDPAARHPSMDALLHAMQRDRRSRRLQWLALAGAVALSLATAGATAFVMQPEPSAEAEALVQRLETEAREAAEHGHFVYPPADAPEAPTALLSVLTLERLEGPVADDARALAEALRREFAQRLVQLGDTYEERDGGEPFAADFYAAALLFEPDHERARARSLLTPGEVATLRKKASDASFTEIELSAAEPLVVLAEPDDDARAERVAALLRDERPPAASTGLHLERLLDDSTRRLIARDRALPDRSPAEPGETPTAVDTQPERTADAPTSTNRDPRAAQAEARAGVAALRAGDDAEAERAFHRALGNDSRNHVALSGLSDLYFERGAYQKALRYADKAVVVAPKNAGYRMQLGDASFKVHRYTEARRQYEAAKKLGHPGAERALARVLERVGER
jgi:tetratricopeptide (TPR) repeat protein